ncbi:MAG: stage III sporulation protein AA [Firmicutes bacterium]|nr:stage III sporulation protein AA [Bacillota bacterium]
MPVTLRNVLSEIPEDVRNSLEEIRIRINQPVRVISGGRELILKNCSIDRQAIDNIMNNLLDYSIYAYEEDLAKGFITIEGGHRVGVCGRVVTENGGIRLIKEISSLNIRRSRAIRGASDKVINEIYDPAIGLQNTIIVSPPKCGKTTLVRDIVRAVSERGMRVGVCDERSEIAGMYQGVPSYDLGPRTDVLDGCIKAEGMLMLIRSMSPDVIVTDEIGRSEDIPAIEAATSAGISIITTIHGNSYEDLMASKIGPLVNQGIFKRIIFLSNIPSTGTVREVRHV